MTEQNKAKDRDSDKGTGLNGSRNASVGRAEDCGPGDPEKSGEGEATLAKPLSKEEEKIREREARFGVVAGVVANSKREPGRKETKGRRKDRDKERVDEEEHKVVELWKEGLRSKKRRTAEAGEEAQTKGHTEPNRRGTVEVWCPSIPQEFGTA